MKRQIPPPIFLKIDSGDDEEEAFLHQKPSKPTKPVFSDQDYTEENKNINRLKKYTFITGKENDTDAKLENSNV